MLPPNLGHCLQRVHLFRRSLGLLEHSRGLGMNYLIHVCSIHLANKINNYRFLGRLLHVFAPVAKANRDLEAAGNLLRRGRGRKERHHAVGKSRADWTDKLAFLYVVIDNKSV
jgi:hypothetical protein